MGGGVDLGTIPITDHTGKTAITANTSASGLVFCSDGIKAGALASTGIGGATAGAAVGDGDGILNWWVSGLGALPL